ncbi:Anti-sigma F factor antagonist [Actinoplanes sp. SE50]|uniref:anti-sigma factor antagonist n=1 Tax=unclassified Actinoplanes TaxID=2626549 RepID=UPI00023EC5CE|nr:MULTISPECIES: STAS domain-containing protein [unclassified Actinoplanes]AEV83624.1 Anti-sigma F factor antagonist [Actinoplanes sp. SE50/110]ATO82232.1 Anti-sigma F factor antagonist [Actinoplanes sp. SE50]SLL99639.1 anti-sigma F factor antagonist [Actinoplanes sp. SE50/110]
MNLPDHSLRTEVHLPDEPGDARLVIVGELDGEETVGLHDAVSRTLRHPATRAVHVDAGDLIFLDSSGIRSLLAARRRAAEAGVELSIVAVSPIVYQILQITGLLPILGVGAGTVVRQPAARGSDRAAQTTLPPSVGR